MPESLLPPAPSATARISQMTAGLALAFLGACAQLPTAATPVAQSAAPAPAAPAAPAAAAEAARPELPRLALTPDVLYQLMMAEIAAQRGLTGPAHATLFELAKRTRDPRIARRALEFALQSRQPANALAAARLWNELTPGDVQAREALINMLLLAGQFLEVESMLRADLASAAAPAETFGSIGALLARSSRRTEALAVMEGLASDFPNLPEAQLAVAQSAQLAGNKSRAITKVRQALALRPDWELAALIGAQYLQPESPAEAGEFLSNFLRNSPRSVSARLALGRVLAGDRKYAEARTEFARVLELQAGNTDALYALGMVNNQLDKPADAERYFKRYLEVAQAAPRPERNISRALLQLAQIEEERKNIPAALDYLGRIKSGEEFVLAQARRATLLASTGKLEQALADLRAVDVDSRDDRLRLIQIESQLLRDNNRLDAAFKVLDDAVLANPDATDLLYDHAMIAEKLNRLEVMEASLRTVIRLKPDAAHAYNALGYSLADRKLRLPEALKLIERALELAPDDAAILDSMGWVHFRLGNNERALEFLRKSYAVRPDAEVGTHLGEVLWVMGQRDEARRLWSDAGKKEPQNEVLRETLTRLNVHVSSN